MSNAAQTKRKVGRPATGVTKEVIKASVGIQLASEAKKIAMRNGESFSQFVSRAIHSLVITSL